MASQRNFPPLLLCLSFFLCCWYCYQLLSYLFTPFCFPIFHPLFLYLLLPLRLEWFLSPPIQLLFISISLLNLDHFLLLLFFTFILSFYTFYTLNKHILISQLQLYLDEDYYLQNIHKKPIRNLFSIILQTSVSMWRFKFNEKQLLFWKVGVIFVTFSLFLWPGLSTGHLLYFNFKEAEFFCIWQQFMCMQIGQIGFMELPKSKYEIKLILLELTANIISHLLIIQYPV